MRLVLYFGVNLLGLVIMLAAASAAGLSISPLEIGVVWASVLLLHVYAYGTVPRWVAPDADGRRNVTPNMLIWVALAGSGAMTVLFVLGYDTIGSARADHASQRLALDLLIAGFGSGTVLIAVLALVPRTSWDADFIYHRDWRLRSLVVPWPDVVAVKTNLRTGYHHIATVGGATVSIIAMNKGAIALRGEALRWAIALPGLFEASVRARDPADRPAFDAALGALRDRDRRFGARPCADGVMLVGPTAAHVALFLSRLRAIFGREISADPPQIVRRATIRASVAREGMHETTRADGSRERAAVELIVRPCDPSLGNRGDCDCVPSGSPAGVAVMRALELALDAGPFDGLPMLGIHVEVIRIEPVTDGADEALAAAARAALAAAIADAQPVALAPWMKCFLDVPADALDATLAYWRARRGSASILRLSRDTGLATIEAHAPLAELGCYHEDLMGITRGRVRPFLLFDRFAPVKGDVPAHVTATDCAEG
jgi:hypothetical protein